MSRALLSLATPAEDRESLLDDLGEEHAARVLSEGRRRADAWYRREALRSLPPMLRERLRRRYVSGVQARSRRTGMVMSELISDVKYAARTLRKSPGFMTVAVLTLALGIGANSAMFSVVNGVVLKPLAYAQPDRLVAIYSQFPTLGFDEFWISPPEYMELKERARSYDVIGAYRTGTISVGGGESPMRVTSAIATMDLFRALGVNPLLGRTFTEEEDIANGPAAVVLGHALWQRAFGGEPSVIGRTVEVDGSPSTVVGVMPPGFDIADAGVEALVPAQLDPANRENRGSHTLNLIGRLRAGVPAEQAQRELVGLVERWAEENPEAHVPTPGGHELFLRPLQDDLIGGIRPALLMLLGAVGFVLLIACANVGNLLLARAEGRGREIAVRAALGAGRVRLQDMERVLHASIAQPRFLTLLLGIFGAIALVLAAIGTYGVMSYSVAERRQEIAIRMALGAEAGGVLAMVLRHGVVVAGLGLALGIAGALAASRTLASLLYGVGARDLTTFLLAPAVLAAVALVACWVPAWRATRVDPARVLRQE